MALFGYFLLFDGSPSAGGPSSAAAAVRPLFLRLMDHIEAYCRSPRRTQTCTVASAAAVAAAERAAAATGKAGTAGDGGRGAWECAAHGVYDDVARIADALQTLSVSHLGRDPARAVDQARARPVLPCARPPAAQSSARPAARVVRGPQAAQASPAPRTRVAPVSRARPRARAGHSRWRKRTEQARSACCAGTCVPSVSVFLSSCFSSSLPVFTAYLSLSVAVCRSISLSLVSKSFSCTTDRYCSKKNLLLSVSRLCLCLSLTLH
jgi:hypothetical protein